MKKRLSVFIVLALLCVGCNTATHKSVFNGRLIQIKNFGIITKIPAKEALLANLPPGITGIEKMDSLVILRHSYNPDFLISVYDIRKDQFLGSLLRKGRGPEEYITISYWGEYDIDDNEDRHIYFSAINEKEILKCNVSDFLRTGRYLTENRYTFSNISYKTHILNDSEFLSYFYDSDKQQVFYRKLSSTKEEYVDYLVFNRTIPSPSDFELLSSANRLSPNKDKIAMGQMNFCFINILDLTNPKNNLSIMPDKTFYESFETVKNKAVEDQIINYIDLKCSPSHIYALYSGQRFNDWQEVEHGVELHIVDWKGKGIARLIIEESLLLFYVDENNKAMYAIDHLENTYIYDLSGII